MACNKFVKRLPPQNHSFLRNSRLRQNMLKKIVILSTLLLLVLNSGCQEVNIYLEYPDEGNGRDRIAMDNVTSTPTFSPTRTPRPIEVETTADFQEEAFDVNAYFFPVEMLPEDIELYYDSIKHYNVSYLQNPGSLLGIAHVRSYYSNDDDLLVMQTIVQSPLPGQTEMLKAGHYERYLSKDNGGASLGDYAMGGFLNSSEENFYLYRFYKGNILVFITLSGHHPFVAKDYAHSLAKAIEEKLPDEFPVVENINTPSLEFHQELAGTYFQQLTLVDCDNQKEIVGNIQFRHQGICFKADVIKLIANLKVGLYDEKYNQIIYMKEFISAPQFGESIYEFLSCEWGFAWSEIHSGDYQVLFWVNDQLVQSIPLSLTATYY